MTDLAKLVVRLEAETGRYQAELEKAKRKLGGFEKSSRADLIKLGKQFGTLAAGAATGMAAVVASVTAAARDIRNQAAVANANVEEFQRMSFATRTVGIEQEKLSDILKDVNDRVGDYLTTGAGPMVDFFERIAPLVDVTADSFRNLSGPQALQLFFDSLERANVSQAEMTFFLEGMASDTTALIPLLREGGKGLKELGDQAADFGVVMSEDAIAQSNAFQDNLRDLQQRVRGVGVQMTEALLPTLLLVSEEMLGTGEDSEVLKLAISGISNVLKTMVTGAYVATAGLDTLGKSLGAVAAIGSIIAEAPITFFVPGMNESQVARIDSVVRSLYQDLGDVSETAAGRVQRVWAETYEAIAAAAEEVVTPEGGEPPGLPDPKLLAAQAQALEQLQSMVLAAQQQLDTFGEGEAAVLAYRLAHGDLADTLALAGAQGQAYASQIVQLSEALEGKTEQARQAAEQEAFLAQIMQEGTALMESLRTPTEAYTATISRLNELIARGAIDQETYNRAVEQAQDSYDKAEKAGNVWAQQLESITDQAARNIQGALADFLFDPFEDGLQGMVRSFANTLQRMAAEAAAAQIFNALGAAAGGGGGGGIADFLGGIFGGGRANGGPVSPGQVYEVGETGREWFVPDVAGQIVPDSKMAGTTIAPTIIVQAPEGRISKATEMQIGAAVTRSGLMASRRNN